MNSSLRMRTIGIMSQKDIAGYYTVYRESQWWDEPRIEAYQRKKLTLLLNHVREHVGFYRDVLGKRHLTPVTENDCLEILAELPIVDKSVLKASPGRFVPDNLPILKGVHSGSSGGTTGEPLKIFTDANTRASVWAVYYRFYTWMGVELSDPRINVWGARIVDEGRVKKTRRRILASLENTLYVDSFRVSERNFDDLRAAFERHKPRHLNGYAQSIYDLARIFEQHGYQFPLKAVSTTAEPLFDEYRPLIRQVFQCEAFNQYGCGEVQSAAFECDRHQGLHVTNERCIIEVLPSKEIVVTDLDNLAFPILRYKMGDLATVSSTPCDCGRIGTVLRRVEGRVGDFIVGLNGTRLHPEFFTHLLNETGVSDRRRLRQYQVRQEDSESVRWLVVAERFEDDDVRVLSAKLIEYLGPMNVEIVNVEAIPPAASGKFQYVVSKVNRSLGTQA